MTWGAAEIQGNPTASIKVELVFFLLLFEFCFVFFGPTLRLWIRLPFQRSKLKTKIFVASKWGSSWPACRRPREKNPIHQFPWIELMGKFVIPTKKHPKAEYIGSMYMVYLGDIFCETWLHFSREMYLNIPSMDPMGNCLLIFVGEGWMPWSFDDFHHLNGDRSPTGGFGGAVVICSEIDLGEFFNKLLILNFLKEFFQHDMLIILICDCLIPHDGGNKKVPTSMEQLSIGRKWSCTCNCIANI